MPSVNEIAGQVVKLFMSISKGSQLYPPTHPAVITPLNNVSEIIRELHKERKIVNFGVVNGLLFLEDMVFYDEDSAVKQLAYTLGLKEISTISVLREFSNEDLFEALRLLSMQTPSSTEKGEMRDKLAEKGITSITVKYTDEEEDIEARAKKTYFDALDVVKSTFDEVRMGRIPKAGTTKKAAKDIVDVVYADHNAMLCLTMIKAYDDYTFNHSVNVSILTVAIAKALGVEEAMLNEIGTAGLLHDIGKTKTEKAVILKPGRLTDQEFSLIKQHPVKGHEILKHMDGINKNTMDIVLQHHVHYDKKGYPKFNPEDELNPYSTMIATADTYDAMTTFRPYQRAVTPKEAIDIMLRFEDQYFEKHIIRKFIEILGIFPTGSFVRLNTNEIALVSKQSAEDISSPIVKIVIDKRGNKVTDFVETDLSEKDASGKKLRVIVSAIDPTFLGLNVMDYV
jgi:putative nucleotidyltransferase with HDIG domain